MKRFQTIIIGLGAMGSAAAYQLTKRGNSVLGLDQFSPPHDCGSSHGETRITRLAIGEGEAYTPLVLRSHEIWRELEELSGKDLLTVTGGLIIGPVTGSSLVHGRSNFIEQTILSANKYGIEHELLSGSDICRRFPQFNAGDDVRAYFEHGAGYLRPETCIEVQLSLAKKQGAEIHLNEQALDFFVDGSGVRVVTDAGEYFAEKLIVSAGPWIGSLLSNTIQLPVKVYRQVLYWFAVENKQDYEPCKFPIFIWDLGKLGDIYGFPIVDGGVEGIKIATEVYVNPTVPEEVERTVNEEEQSLFYGQFIESRLSGVLEQCLKTATCLYTVTPDSNFIVDTLPGLPQIIIASPCSGHGFKHSAAIGEILAELVIDGRSKLDISTFRLPLNGL